MKCVFFTNFNLMILLILYLLHLSWGTMQKSMLCNYYDIISHNKSFYEHLGTYSKY